MPLTLDPTNDRRRPQIDRPRLTRISRRELMALVAEANAANAAAAEAPPVQAADVTS